MLGGRVTSATIEAGPSRVTLATVEAGPSRAPCARGAPRDSADSLKESRPAQTLVNAGERGAAQFIQAI